MPKLFGATNFRLYHHLLNLSATNNINRDSPNNNAFTFPEVYERPVHKRQQTPAFFIRF